MNEKQAKQIAQILSGEAWQSGGGIWLVILRQGNGKLVVISDEAVCEYDDEQHFEQSTPAKTYSKILDTNYLSYDNTQIISTEYGGRWEVMAENISDGLDNPLSTFKTELVW